MTELVYVQSNQTISMHSMDIFCMPSDGVLKHCTLKWKDILSFVVNLRMSEKLYLDIYMYVLEKYNITDCSIRVNLTVLSIFSTSFQEG